VELLERQNIWILGGGLIDSPIEKLNAVSSDRFLSQNRDHVRITTGPKGTEISWYVFAPNWASLFFVREWLVDLPRPYNLRFFAYGWFEELHETSIDAINRIDELIAKSDLRFLSPVFTRELSLTDRHIIPDFAEALNTGAVPTAASVMCEVDLVSERTRVMHVGEQSALASIWGKTTVAFPCLSGHSYDKIVSRPYFDVIRTGKPHYDHVLAAMTQPDGETRWLGYQRLIMPSTRTVNGRPAVEILCHRGAVDIRVP
jgi:hypothetical protein